MMRLIKQFIFTMMLFFLLSTMCIACQHRRNSILHLSPTTSKTRIGNDFLPKYCRISSLSLQSVGSNIIGNHQHRSRISMSFISSPNNNDRFFHSDIQKKSTVSVSKTVKTNDIANIDHFLQTSVIKMNMMSRSTYNEINFMLTGDGYLSAGKYRTRTTAMALLATKKKNTDSETKTVASGGFGKALPKSLPKQQLRSISSNFMGSGNKELRDAANTFDRIRKMHGLQSSYDIYVRSPINNATTFWFVGKVAIEPSNNNDDDYQPTIQDACISQKRLILEYSKLHLRPQNFAAPKYSSALEIWVAPGDSEMDVVQNKVNLIPIRGSAANISTEFHVDSVGYNPEIYLGDEKIHGGLRVQRNETGYPMKSTFEVYEDTTENQ